MKKLIFSFLLLISFNGFAQTAQEQVKNAMDNFDFKLALAIVREDTANTDPEWKFLQVSILKTLSRYSEASGILLKIKEENPSLRVLVELINCYSSAGNLPKSLFFCREALKIAPENAFLKIREAELLFETGSYKESYACYDTLYMRDSTLLFLNQMGLCQEYLKQPKEAIHLYKQVLAIDPFNYSGANRLLNLHIKLGQYEEAYAFSENFLERDTTDSDIIKLNGISKFFTKRYKDAVALFEKLYERGDSSYVVLRYLGLGYYMDKDYYPAVEHLPLALEMDSANLDLRFALGVSCSRSSYQKEGVRYLESVRDKLLPDETFLFRIYDELGEAYFRTRNYEKSLENRLLAAEYSQQKSLSYYQVASVFQLLEKKQESLTYYQLAWDNLDPTDTAEEFPGPGGTMVKTFRGALRQQLDRLKKELYPLDPAYGSLSADSLSRQ